MEKLKLNSKIEIVNKDEKKTQGIIYDIVEDKIIVTIPSDDREFKLLRVGEEVNCIYYDKKNTIGFYGDIEDRVYQNMPAYVIANAREFQKIQRRQDVRIPISIEIFHTSNKFVIKAYENNNKKDILKKAKRYLNEGIMADISGGGARFTCYDNLPQGSVLLLSFKLGDNTFVVKAVILHEGIKVVANKTVYTYGVKFKDISEKDKEKIIKHIFLMMRKKRIK
jgi:c-di-GMP-binding flagellar brake protein YcgR